MLSVTTSSSSIFSIIAVELGLERTGCVVALEQDVIEIIRESINITDITLLIWTLLINILPPPNYYIQYL
jgi:hypothetical protein